MTKSFTFDVTVNIYVEPWKAVSLVDIVIVRSETEIHGYLDNSGENDKVSM